MQKEVSKIYKTLVKGGEVSLAVLDTTALVKETARRHGLSPVSMAALGRTMTATAYLCSWLKGEESSLYVTVSGDGAGGKISVSGDGALHLRGNIAVPDLVLPPRADGKLDVGGCVGRKGTLTVVRDDGEGIPFVGTSELLTGEIAEDFSAYFLTSEQRPTAIALGVLVSREGECLGAGGVFLQPMPAASEEAIAFAEQKITNFSNLSSLIAEKGAEGILKEYFGVESAEAREISFRCRCSREKAASAVLSMGREDAEKLLEEAGEIAVHCHDCNTDYLFGAEDIAALFGKKDTKKDTK